MSGKNALILLGFRASPHATYVKAQWFTSQQCNGRTAQESKAERFRWRKNAWDSVH